MGFYKWFILCIFYVNIFIIVAVKNRISDYRRCADASCSVLISTAVAQLTYNSDDPRILSFPARANIEVYSYDAGTREDLWGIKYKGKRGYGPKSMLRENKLFVSSKDVNIIVPTEVNSELSILDSKVNIEKNVVASGRGFFGIIGASAEPDIKPNKVRVVEGTTLYNMESSPDDENISDGVEGLVTPPGMDGLPLPIPKQVPESATAPSVEPSKSDKTAGDTQSESVNESDDSVQSKTIADTSSSSSSSSDGGGGGGETKESHDGGMSERNVSAREEGDYADYEEEEEEDDEFEEGEVEDESEEMNVTVTTERTGKESVAESTSASDVKSENVTEKGVEQQQNVHDAESIHATGSSDTKEEPSQVQNKSLVESVTEHPDTLVSVEGEQSINMTVNETKQLTEDVAVGQTTETVQQSEVQLDSPLATEHEVHSDVDTSNVIGSDNISDQPQFMVTQGEIDISKKEEKQIGEVKSDKVSEIINSSSDIIQEETTKTEENQNIEEKPAIEHIGSMLEQDLMQTVKQPDPPVNESNMRDDSGNVAESSVESGSNQQQQFVSNKGHSDGNMDTEKANTEDTLPTISYESDETENVGESESVTDLLQEASTEQSVGIDSKDDSGMFSTLKQEEVATNEEPEEVYGLTGDGLPLPSFPEKLPESTASEEPSVSEEASSKTISEVFTASIMMWMSSVKTLQNYFQSPTSYSDIPNTGEEPSNTVSSMQENIVESNENWDQSKSDSLKDKSCLMQNLGDEDSCEKVTKLPPPRVWAQSDSTSEGYEMFGTVIDFEKLPFETILWLLITAGTILTFTLGHYYIEAHRRDGLLVARINKLERELLVLRKESSLLEDQLLKAQDEIQAVDSSSSEAEALITSLKMELEENKAIRMDLEDQVTSLERELESVTESGLEMHRLLSESLSNQDGSQVLLKTVENLREKLNAQDAEISFLNQNIVEKNEEIESLKNDLVHSQDMYKHVEERFSVLQREKEEEALELKDKHRALSAQLEEVIESKALDEMRMSTEISKFKLNIEEVQRNFAEKEAELETMRDAVKQLQSTEKNLNIDALYDVVSISAKLKAMEKEKDEFREKFLEEEGARKLLEDHVRVISREVASLKENFEAAEKEKIDALTKLQVLSNYFKEKESQLQKELGLQESMWLQKQSDDHTIYEQMKSLREENEKYKLQNESLKKEICEQESSFKIQIANIEQRAHENWVACRQSERRLKEVQQEASQLRNRLTLSEKNAANHTLDDSKPKISESNGDPSSPPPSLIFPATTSPPFMMYTGLPGEFIPPPPLVSAPPFSPDSRPPPLGRISSPQLDPRFSPPPPLPYSPYDFPYGGHHSPSPPPPLPQHRTVHKPQPRENAREQKDSSSTNYNTSETADKPSRRNKR